jgi:hypothetical protein
LHLCLLTSQCRVRFISVHDSCWEGIGKGKGRYGSREKEGEGALKVMRYGDACTAHPHIVPATSSAVGGSGEDRLVIWTWRRCVCCPSHGNVVFQADVPILQKTGVDTHLGADSTLVKLVIIIARLLASSALAIHVTAGSLDLLDWGSVRLYAGGKVKMFICSQCDQRCHPGLLCAHENC